MAYKYLNTARINSTIKKHSLRLEYTKGESNFHFVDLSSGLQVGNNLQIKRMHEYTIDQWRSLAEQYRNEFNLSQAAKTVEEIAA
jgi:hypothetical protein